VCTVQSDAVKRMAMVSYIRNDEALESGAVGQETITTITTIRTAGAVIGIKSGSQKFT
jgi:hypothetical protein